MSRLKGSAKAYEASVAKFRQPGFAPSKPKIPLTNTRLYVETAKIFRSGRSQAVRLPKDFRFEGNEVRIRRHGNSVILEPIAQDWAWLDAIVEPLDDDFMRGVAEQPDEQGHPSLSFFE